MPAGRRRERRANRVAVLLFDGCPLFETSVPLSVFGVDRSDTGAPVFDIRAVAGEPGPVVTTAGVVLTAPHGLAAVDRAGIVIVPTWRDPAEQPPAAVLAALRRAHREGALILGLCLGAFVLAAAGLLDGRRAATHWRYAERLAAAHPAVEVDPAVLYVDDGQVITSAGTAAGLDACLHVVRREYGAAAAAAIARRMVVSPHRSGGQAQFRENPLPTQAGAELSDVLAWALDNLDAGLDVQSLSNRAHLSRRTFDRRFREVVGTSPLDWLLHQRVLEAQRLLEGSDLTVDTVASRVGFSNAVAMRPHFRRIVGVSPQSYRQSFRTR
jgi:transcriptional regulator GlxA family with amidase domain